MNEIRFLFMHRDDIVCTVSVDTATGAFLRVSRPDAPELLPPGGRAGADAFRRWWQRRAVPLSQDRIRAFLSDHGLSTPQEFLVRNLGLSLSDHYWIKPAGSEMAWADVNFFTNDFGDGEFEGTHPDKAAGAPPKYSPRSSTLGDLSKRWIIADGKRRLVKGNRGGTSQNSLNEIAATLLHAKQNVQPFCAYEAFRPADARHLHCVCDCFTSDELEFIPAIDVIDSRKKPNTVSLYEHFIRVCAENGLEEDRIRAFLEYQILTDCILTNTDRHLNNFGVLRDTRSLRFVAPAPIFDSGNSMFWNDPTLPLHDPLTDVPVNSLYKTEARLLELVRDRSRVNLSRLPTEDDLRAVYAPDPLIAPLDAILLGYRKKIDLLANLPPQK